MNQTLDAVDPDPKRFLDAAARVIDDLRSGHNPLDEGGIATLLASPDQRELFGRIGGMMSLLEGHGDVTMDRAGEGHVPSAPRFSRALRERRRQGGSTAKVLQKVMGIDAKMKQYAQGESFIAYVERHGGPDSLDAAWRGPEWLPDAGRDPGAAGVARPRPPVRGAGRVIEGDGAPPRSSRMAPALRPRLIRTVRSVDSLVTELLAGATSPRPARR